MSPTVIQEIETRRPNTSSQNITEKEIKNLSKFFVLNLKLKIKPKHLRGTDGTLRLKCTAEESCVLAEIIFLFLHPFQVLDLYWRSVEVSLTVVRSSPPPPPWFSPAFAISAGSAVPRTLKLITFTLSILKIFNLIQN